MSLILIKLLVQHQKKDDSLLQTGDELTCIFWSPIELLMQLPNGLWPGLCALKSNPAKITFLAMAF